MHVSGAQRTVRDGPFTPVAELDAGFWLWQVRSIDEAVEWVRRCPNPTDEDCVFEIRPVAEAAEAGEAYASTQQAPAERRPDTRLRPAPPPSPHTP